LIEAVDHVFAVWRRELSGRHEIVAPFEKPYFVGSGMLNLGSGLTEIHDYAKKTNHQSLLKAHAEMQERLKETKEEFYEFLVSEDGLHYFDQTQIAAESGIITLNAINLLRSQSGSQHRKAA